MEERCVQQCQHFYDGGQTKTRQNVSFQDFIRTLHRVSHLFEKVVTGSRDGIFQEHVLACLQRSQHVRLLLVGGDENVNRVHRFASKNFLKARMSLQDIGRFQLTMEATQPILGIFSKSIFPGLGVVAFFAVVSIGIMIQDN